METDNMIGLLALLTLALGLVFGVWQYFRLQNAKRNHERSGLENVSATAKAGGIDDAANR